MLYEIVQEICEAKRGKVHPVLATELELKRELSRRGVMYTTESFRQMCSELATDPRITTIRTLNYTAYANNTEEPQEGLSAKARGAGQTTTGKHSILPKPAVAKSEETLSRPTPTVRGVPEGGEDNPSDGGGPHYADKYWWSEI
jgi:hypothetical protein